MYAIRNKESGRESITRWDTFKEAWEALEEFCEYYKKDGVKMEDNEVIVVYTDHPF